MPPNVPLFPSLPCHSRSGASVHHLDGGLMQPIDGVSRPQQSSDINYLPLGHQAALARRQLPRGFHPTMTTA